MKRKYQKQNIDVVLPLPSKGQQKLPSIFKRISTIDYGGDYMNILEPHSTDFTLADAFVLTEERGQDLPQEKLQQQGDLLKVSTNPNTGELIGPSVYSGAIKSVDKYKNIPLYAAKAGTFDYTDNMRKYNIDALFTAYAINAISNIITQANNMFLQELAIELNASMKSTKVVVGEYAAYFGFAYNRNKDEIEANMVFDPQIFISYTEGRANMYSVDPKNRQTYNNIEISRNAIPNMAVAASSHPYPAIGDLVRLNTYECCKDFWILLSELLPIMAINYNTFIDGIRNSSDARMYSELVNIYINSYNTVVPVVINMLENLVYTLWCESDIYIAAKYNGSRPSPDNDYNGEYEYY